MPYREYTYGVFLMRTRYQQEAHIENLEETKRWKNNYIRIRYAR